MSRLWVDFITFAAMIVGTFPRLREDRPVPILPISTLNPEEPKISRSLTKIEP